MNRWIPVAAIVLACAFHAACGEDAREAESDPGRAKTREIMREIFAGIRVALPASANGEHFGDAGRRAEILAALDTLANGASVLQEHAREADAQVQFLAHSVDRDARDVRREYANGHYQRAAFLLRQITENCIVCHTRLPSRRDARIGERFVDSSTLKSLPLESRVNLRLATRRFDEALTDLESVLESEAHAATMIGPLTDYLVVSIRVKNDFERPIPALARFAKRPDVWTRLRDDVGGWVAALPELERRASRDPELATARALMDEGSQLSLYQGDHAALAHFVVASSILEDFIDEHRERDRDLAEAYYLLGIVEARIGRNYWVTPAPFLLESSIRLAPREPFAEQAYALLERELLMSYEGSEFEALPEEDAARLRELRALIDGR